VGDRVVEHVLGVPHPRLRPFVTEYVGYLVDGFDPGVHAGLPSRALTFIVAFDEPLEVAATTGAPRDVYWSMLAGLQDRPAFVHHSGRQHGVQLRVTPEGAFGLFGVRAGELANETLHLGDVAPVIDLELVERLTGAATWRARWAVLDDVLGRALHERDDVAPELGEAWDLLERTHGGVSVESLAVEVGWSRRHLAQRFRAEFGMTPKVMGRVMRFEWAQQLLRLPTRPTIASVAAVSGYADQAHLTRDWHQFAGTSPTEWLRDETMPDVAPDPTDPVPLG
jgi:AraC-like DNA-binding protein